MGESTAGPKDDARLGKPLADDQYNELEGFERAGAGIQIMSPNFVAQPPEPVLPPPATKGE